MLTVELGLALSVCPLTVAAGRTRLTRVSRVNFDHGDASRLCLVAEERAQLGECPAAEEPAKMARTVRSATNARQGFDGECLSLLHGLGDERLA